MFVEGKIYQKISEWRGRSVQRKGFLFTVGLNIFQNPDKIPAHCLKSSASATGTKYESERKSVELQQIDPANI